MASERYDYEPESPTEHPAFTAEVRRKCICAKSIVIDGVEYEGLIKSPSCTIHNPSPERLAVPVFRLGRNERTVGVIRSRGPNRQ